MADDSREPGGLEFLEGPAGRLAPNRTRRIFLDAVEEVMPEVGVHLREDSFPEFQRMLSRLGEAGAFDEDETLPYAMLRGIVQRAIEEQWQSTSSPSPRRPELFGDRFGPAEEIPALLAQFVEWYWRASEGAMRCSPAIRCTSSAFP